MDAERLFFDTQFKERLEETLRSIQYPLSDSQEKQADTWVALYQEDDESLGKRSKSRRSVRRRVRYFARKVYGIKSQLFVLCSLSFSISGLPTIPDDTFYDELGNWWALKSPSEKLSNATNIVCRGFSQNQRQDSQVRLSAQTRPKENDSALPDVSSNFQWGGYPQPAGKNQLN